MQNTADLSKFSLIFPDEVTQTAHFSGKNRPKIDMFALEELGLTEIIKLKNSDLDEYFTSDPRVIRHRMEVFGDMLEFPEISATLNRLIPILNDIMELRRLEADSGNTESYLESITEIELYISSISALYDGLAPIQEEYKRLMADKGYLEGLLRENADKASYIASKTLSKVYRKIGFLAK